MTKEAKVGMLTGLAVIVLIGVLLSEYLGTPGSRFAGMPGPANVATGRMANLPLGQAKRDEILQPVGVPTMARLEDGQGSGGVILAQVPTAYAAESVAPAAAPAGPVMHAPVAAEPAGPVQVASLEGNDLPPTMQLGGPSLGSPAGDSASAGAAAAELAKAAVKPAPVGQPYVIARGDTLDKISRKFYKSAGSEAKGRIVAANPSLLKNGQPWLIAGRTITIPQAVEAAPTPEAKRTPAPLVIRQPGSAVAAKAVPVKATDSGKAVGKTYVVKPGDSLEKIARKLDSENYRAVIKKLMAANGIKDAAVVEAGQVLKLPA